MLSLLGGARVVSYFTGLAEAPWVENPNSLEAEVLSGKDSLPSCEGTSRTLHGHLAPKSVVDRTPVWSSGISRVWSPLAWRS